MSRETFIAEVVRRRHDLAMECNENAEHMLRTLMAQHGLCEPELQLRTVEPPSDEFMYFLEQVSNGSLQKVEFRREVS